jgi:hypothetical protein
MLLELAADALALNRTLMDQTIGAGSNFADREVASIVSIHSSRAQTGLKGPQRYVGPAQRLPVGIAQNLAINPGILALGRRTLWRLGERD